MAYNPFDDSLPVSTATGPQTVTDIRDNQQAMRDMVVGDFAVGWNMSTSGGTAEEPAVILYTNASDTDEQIKESITWSGGNPTSITYDYTSDNWVAVDDEIGVLTPTYDGDDNVTATTWS